MREKEQGFWISARHWQPEAVVPRVYAPAKEKICLDFFPLQSGYGRCAVGGLALFPLGAGGVSGRL